MLKISVLVMVAVLAAGVQAAFIVEFSGLASDHFSYPGGAASSSQNLHNTAIGCTNSGGTYGHGISAFGGNGATDTYIFSYTPGTDADNFSPATGTDLGNNGASGVAGGGSGLYNVYLTWPDTTNISGGTTTIVLTSDSSVDPVYITQNDWNAGANAAGANKWMLLAQVSLSAGSTYTVTMTPTTSSYVSMRAQGVMWEAVPEPTTMLLLGVGGLLLRRRR